jgi:membrane AbrB-like protein
MIAARTLVLGAAGGWLFSIIGLPLPWLTGPIAFTAVLAVTGVSVDIPDWFRPVIFTMLGIIIGSRVDQQMLADLARWPLSLGLLVLYVPAAIVTMFVYFRLVARADPNTALVSSSPGSLAYVLAYAADSGADMRKVVVTQSVRLGILVLLLPMALTQAAPPAPPAKIATKNPQDQKRVVAPAAARRARNGG